MIAITPSGHLVPAFDASAEPLPGLRAAFDLGVGHALLNLGGDHVGESLPATLAWWRDFAASYIGVLCTLPEAAESLPDRLPPPEVGELQKRLWSAPPMDGGEYLAPGILEGYWRDLDHAFHEALRESGCQRTPKVIRVRTHMERPK